nr:hypothetical protein [Tanacetum cinerariifolium]
ARHAGAVSGRIRNQRVRSGRGHAGVCRPAAKVAAAAHRQREHRHGLPDDVRRPRQREFRLPLPRVPGIKNGPEYQLAQGPQTPEDDHATHADKHPAGGQAAGEARRDGRGGHAPHDKAQHDLPVLEAQHRHESEGAGEGHKKLDQTHGAD